MSYLYRLERNRRGPFQHPVTQEILAIYQDEWYDHIGTVEPDNEVPSLLADNGMTHYNARFACRSIQELIKYMGEFILDQCIQHDFRVVRYEVPDDDIKHGQNQVMFSMVYHKCGTNLGCISKYMGG